MSQSETSFSAWPIRAWVMAALLFVATGASVAGGIFGRPLVLDLVSLWPGLILTFLVAAALYPLHKGKVSRLAAVLPLLLISWLGSTIGLYLIGWDVLPSSAGDFGGPAVDGIASAALTLHMAGPVHLSGGNIGVLYDVELDRAGGVYGAPEALERVVDGEAQIALAERADAGWYTTAGWQVVLAENVVWWLSLDGSGFEADLTTLTLTKASFAGEGSVTLPVAIDATYVEVSGTISLNLPSGGPVEVVGELSSIPPTWVQTDDGATRPGEGPVYFIDVSAGSTLSLTEW